jgi:Domain of unknown function (DUF4406)
MLDKSLIYYLAGPMTGIPQFNFPAFEQSARELRALGFTIISPHEQDSAAVQVAALASKDGALDAGKIAGETWGQILAKDVILVADKVDGIIFMPGWWNSRGAKLEAVVGLLTGKLFGFYAPAGSYDAAMDEIRTAPLLLERTQASIKATLECFL